MVFLSAFLAGTALNGVNHERRDVKAITLSLVTSSSIDK